MPHYKDGKEAKVGDFVKFKEGDDVHIGKLEKIHAGTTCNAQVSHVIHVPQATIKTVTLKDAELVHRKEYEVALEEDKKVAE